MRVVKWLTASGIALVALALTSGAAYAQTTSASVSGTVTDTQGAVLSGVSVTLTSNTQGDTLTAVTDPMGNFLFPYVRPGTYTLKFTLSGFTTVEKTRVVVNANDRFSAGSVALEVGAVSETVTVVGRAVELQTDSGERSYTLESTAIENIAVNGRSFFGLIGLVPGVVPGVGQGNTQFTDSPPTQVSQFAVNGQRTNSNNMTIDGAANIDTGDNGGNMATTNLDAVAEFKVLTSSYQAEFGRAVGAQVQLVTKSGGQDFHGSAYWYGRRSDWNANSWLNNRAGVAQADASRNDFGYTVGGPIYVPGGFNADKRKLFFFFSQEFQRRNDPVAETRVTVPTALERQGDFSKSLDASGNPYPYVRDFTSGLPCGPTDTRGCFQDGGVLGRIPQSRLYGPGLAVLNLYPLPNAAGNKGFNYRSQAPSSQPRREELLRIDFHPNDNWRVMGRYMQDKDDRTLPYGVNWAAGSNLDTFKGFQNVPGRNWLFSATGILDPMTSLEVSVGSAHNSLDIGTSSADLFRSEAGLTSFPMLFPDAVLNDAIPRFRFGANGGLLGTSGNTTGGPAEYFMQQNPFTNFNTTYDAVANITRIAGSHALKAGVYFQRSLKDQSAFAPFNGSIDFGNDSNNPYDTGDPYANAITGVYNQYQQASKYAKPQWRYSNLEWYAQDNWKATNRLTFDYGVRFYYMTPQWDISKQASNFLPDQYDAAKAVRLYQPAMIDGKRVGYDAQTGQSVPSAFIGRIVPGSGDRFNGTFQAGRGIDETLSSGNKFRVSPRFGFAYDVAGSKSAIVRGAFGIFYDRPQGNIVFNLINNPPGLAVTTLQWGRLQDLSGATPLYGPVSLSPTAYDWKPPKVYGWNVGVQLKLPAAFVLDVAYVGSESRDLIDLRQINAVPYGAKYLAQNQDPTRGVPGGLPSSSLPGGNALPDDLLRPYPGYSNINLWEFNAMSNYHALQTSLTRRFDKGLMVGVNYTYSKALGTANDDYAQARIDGLDREANYAPLAIDRPHNFTLNFVYQTPKLTDGSWGVVLNDWQISGVYRWMSGNPYAVTAAITGVSASNLTGSDNNQGARIVLVGDPGKGWSGDPYRQINAAAFAAPKPGSIGNESARWFLYGPPTNNLDLSLSKSFRMGATRRVEVRLDAFNALNHTQYSGVNSTLNFASLTNPTPTNLPYDAAGNLVNPNGFGTVNGVRLPRQLQLVTRFSF